MFVFEFRFFILRALLTGGICVITCEADVPCACNINTEVAVHELDYDKSLVIGHILKHECKPQIHIHTSKIDSGWIAVIMDQKVGFVQNSPNVVEKSCMAANNAYDGYLCPRTGHLMTYASQTANCYEFVDILKEPRDLAETYCQLNDGHLLSVTSVGELEFVFSIAPKNATVSTQFWTGLSTIKSNSSWSDGSDTSFLMSLHRNPRNTITNPSICTVYEASGKDGVWSDSDCATPHGFICKYVHKNLTISSCDAKKTPNSIQPTPSSSCKHVFEHLDRCPKTLNFMSHASILGHCYEFVLHSRRIQTLAELYCKFHGGQLLSIVSDIEDEYIYQTLVNNGFRNRTFWAGIKTTRNGYQWLDGSSTDHLLFIYKNLTTPGSCFILEVNEHESILRRTDCNLDYEFICKYKQKPLDSSVSNIPIPGNVQLCTLCCEEHISNGSSYAFAHYGTSCYEILYANNNWQNAQDTCLQLGGKILNITNAEERAFVEQFLKHYGIKQDMWLLGYDHPLHMVNETCAVLEPQFDGQWDMLQCGEIADATRGVICEYELTHAASSFPSTHPVIIG